MQKSDEPGYPPFPPQYAHLEELVKDAEKKMESIDQKIKNTGVEKLEPEGPAPGGVRIGNKEFLRAQRLAELNRQKSELKSDTLNRMAIETANADPKLSRKMLDQVAFRLDTDNAFRRMDKDQMKEAGNKERPLKPASDPSKDYSYDYMASLHYKGQTFEQPTKLSDKKEVEKQPDKEKVASYSARFFQSLNYTKEIDRLNEQEKEGKPFEQNKEDITREAPEQPDLEP